MFVHCATTVIEVGQQIRFWKDVFVGRHDSLFLFERRSRGDS